MPREFRDYIDSQEGLVRNIAERAVEAHDARIALVRECECSKHSCSNDYLHVPCTEILGTPDICKAKGRRVDNATSSFRTPPGTNPDYLSQSLKENICVYQQLDETFKRIHAAEEYGWTYIGTRDGHFRIYPSAARPRGDPNGDEALGGCAPFDPRQRPWYIGASTGPKDIVLVVDKSGSMNDVAGFNEESRWDIAKRAVKDILGTLTLVDFVNVVVFSDKAQRIWQLSDLVRARSHHIETLRSEVDQTTASGSTNFTAAFEMAFRLLTNACDGEASCSHCHKVILFLTDGMDTTAPDDKSIQRSQMVSVVEEMQQALQNKTGTRASIFTYSMSKDADDAIPRQLACANNGSWSFIGANTNTFDALNSYYLYFASGRTNAPIWIEPYEDADGLGTLTTVAIPFFAKGTDEVPDVFLGVVGHDVEFHELEVGGVTTAQALNAIVDRSRQCSPSAITPCEQQIYRQAQNPLSECPDIVPSRVIDPDSCFMFGDSAYKVFTEAAVWDSAREICEEDGGQLVSVLSEEELAFVSRFAARDGSWVGARRAVNHRFAWTDDNAPELDETSDYWGVREPIFVQGEDPCVAIDSRGVLGNLFVKSCAEKAPFICKYGSRRSCGGQIRAMPERGYYELPLASSCQSEEILDATTPIDDADNLLSSDVMCPLGKARSTEEVTCCPNPGDDRPIEEEAWFWFLISLAAVFLATACCLCYHRRRMYAWCKACCPGCC